MDIIYVGFNPLQQFWRRRVKKGDIKTQKVDFQLWNAQAGSDVTTVTPSVEQGNASIGAASLSGGVWSAPITFSQPGYSMIKLLATNGTDTEAVYIEYLATEPRTVEANTDYGLYLGG